MIVYNSGELGPRWWRGSCVEPFRGIHALLSSALCIFFFFVFLFFLGSYPWHMEVPRLEVESEL